MDFTEFSKIWEGYKELPVDKVNNQMFKPHAMKDKRKFKQMAQQKYEYGADNHGWGEGGKVRDAHDNRKPERAAKAYKKRREDKEKENRAGKGTHQKVVGGVLGTDKDKLEDNFNKKTAKKESLDFTQFLEAIKEPSYKVKGKGDVCPKGHRLDAQTGTCVPMGPVKNSQNPDQKELNSAATGYNVWGATGLNGDGYALEENILDKDFEKQDKKEQEFKKSDERMKYGKDGKPQTDLLPGEVKKFNKETGKWESNK